MLARGNGYERHQEPLFLKKSALECLDVTEITAAGSMKLELKSWTKYREHTNTENSRGLPCCFIKKITITGQERSALSL
jgi:hypothetical protein